MLPDVEVLEEKWHQFRGRVKARWDKINDEELDQIRSRAEQLVDLLQEKYGYTRERAQAELATLRDYRDFVQDRAHETAQSVADRLERKEKSGSRWKTLGLVLLALGLAAAAWRWLQPFIKVDTGQFTQTGTYR